MLSPTLTKLWLWNIPSLVELPCSFKNLNQLKMLTIRNCRNLETLPTVGINLASLDNLEFSGCSRLRSFPDISTNILRLHLDETGIEEVPWQIEKFSKLTTLNMNRCSRLKCVSLPISKLKHLEEADFSDCGTLTSVELSGFTSGTVSQEEASSSLPHTCVPKVNLNFWDCFNLDPETVLDQQSIIFKSMILPGEEVPSYFTHPTTGTSSTSLPNIPLLPTHLSQPFFRFRVCAVVTAFDGQRVSIQVDSCFKSIFENSVNSSGQPYRFFDTRKGTTDLLIFDCRISLDKGNYYDHVDM